MMQIEHADLLAMPDEKQLPTGRAISGSSDLFGQLCAPVPEAGLEYGKWIKTLSPELGERIDSTLRRAGRVPITVRNYNESN